VWRLAKVCCETGSNYMTATQAPAVMLALSAENARLRAEVERLRKAVIAAENGFRILMEPDLRAEMCSALRGDRHD